MRRAALAFGIAVGVLAGPGAAATATEACAPWPGEPSPLPTPQDEDTLRAEWATLRVRDLASMAQHLEPSDPLRARQLWRRLLCMEPGNDAALAGIFRTPPVVVHRPTLSDAPADEAPQADAWAGLSSPVGVGGRRSNAAAAQEIAAARAADERRALRDAVSALETRVREAHFDEALAETESLRRRLDAAAPGAEREALRAELEVLAATAELAKGREDEAVARLRQALAANPQLALDSRTTSPKVLRALQRARAGATP